MNVGLEKQKDTVIPRSAAMSQMTINGSMRSGGSAFLHVVIRATADPPRKKARGITVLKWNDLKCSDSVFAPFRKAVDTCVETVL